MADISLKRTHTLGLKSAHAAANKMADRLAEKFDLKGTWSGNTMNFSRPGVTGKLEVSDHEMTLEVSLGFMLKMMKGPIEKSVHEQLDNVLVEAATKPSPKVAAKGDAKRDAKSGKAPVAKKPAAKKK